MKKYLKIILFLIFFVTIITAIISINSINYAIDVRVFTPKYDISVDKEKEVAQKIFGLITNITVAASVVIIAFLGLKFMLGSVEQRAEYKKSFIPLIIGVFILVSASGIMNVVWNINKKESTFCKNHSLAPYTEDLHRCINDGCNYKERHYFGDDDICDKCFYKKGDPIMLEE